MLVDEEEALIRHLRSTQFRPEVPERLTTAIIGIMIVKSTKLTCVPSLALF